MTDMLQTLTDLEVSIRARIETLNHTISNPTISDAGWTVIWGTDGSTAIKMLGDNSWNMSALGNEASRMDKVTAELIAEKHGYKAIPFHQWAVIARQRAQATLADVLECKKGMEAA